MGWKREADDGYDMQDAERLDYTVDNEPAGVWTSARNLTYVKVCATRLPQILSSLVFSLP